MKSEEDTPYLGAAVDPNDASRVRLYVFGRTLVLAMAGQEEAAKFADDWNTHLSEEWQRVRETNSSLLEAYTGNLCNRGVSRGLADAALADLKKAVEKAEKS